MTITLQCAALDVKHPLFLQHLIYLHFIRHRTLWLIVLSAKSVITSQLWPCSLVPICRRRGGRESAVTWPAAIWLHRVFRVGTASCRRLWLIHWTATNGWVTVWRHCARWNSLRKLFAGTKAPCLSMECYQFSLCVYVQYWMNFLDEFRHADAIAKTLSKKVSSDSLVGGSRTRIPISCACWCHHAPPRALRPPSLTVLLGLKTYCR